MKKSYMFRVRAVFAWILAIALLVAPCVSMRDSQAKKKYYKIGKSWVGFDKNTGRLTWSDGLSYIPKKVAGKKVKIIGEWAYSENKNVKNLTVPKTVKKIEKGAFYNCPKLEKIVLPKKVQLGDVGDNRIFWASNQLKTVVNNPDKKWIQRMQTFTDTLSYLSKQDPQYYVDNVRSFKNQWIVAEDGSHVDYTDEAWDVVVKKAEALTAGCTTDREKAVAISNWIVGYLHYDTVWMEKFQEWRKTHDENTEVFPLKKVTDAYGLITWNPSEHEGETAMTTCGGYGNLTQALFCAAGIPCVHVHRVQKEGEKIDHVFNVAYVGGKWIWIDNTYTDEEENYFDCQIAGFSASDHRCDRLNLVNLEDLIAGTEDPTGQKLATKSDKREGDDREYVTVDGKSWGINRQAGSITWFPKDWSGPEIPTEIDGMQVTQIGKYACQYHDNLRELIIPEGITEIGEGAFRGNARLSTLTVAASVKTIGDYAFQHCDELETVNYLGDKKKIYFGNNAFTGAFFLHPDFSSAYKKGIYYKQLNEVKMTGDFSDDMVAIGASQEGYHQGNDESEMHGYNKLGGEYYAEYNYYTNSPDWQWGMKDFVKQSDYKWGYGGWCGNFCNWCMSMAGLPSECSAYYGEGKEVKWKDTVYAGGSYEIKAGDILHMSAGHYCMVTGVKTDGNKVRIRTLNGNPDVSYKTYVLNKKDGTNDENHNYDLDEVLPLDEGAAVDVKAFTVSFDADGGSGGATTKKVYEGACYGVLPKPVRNGYTFVGWFTEKNGGGKQISAYRNVWLDGDITVYAKWEPGDEPAYLDKDSYVSHAPEHSSISEQFARVYLTKSSFFYKDVKKKAQKTRIKRMNGHGKMSFKNVTEGSKKKYIKISKKGVVTIKKGAPRGTYAVHVTVERDGTVNMTQSTVYIVIK